MRAMRTRDHDTALDSIRDAQRALLEARQALWRHERKQQQGKK